VVAIDLPPGARQIPDFPGYAISLDKEGKAHVWSCRIRGPIPKGQAYRLGSVWQEMRQRKVQRKYNAVRFRVNLQYTTRLVQSLLKKVGLLTS